MAYGQQTLGVVGSPTMVLAADPNSADWKVGGITLDWGTVATPGADVTLPDGTVIPSGKQYLRYGQPVCLIKTAEVQTATFTGGPTGGSAIFTLPASGIDPAQSTNAIAFNASAATVEVELKALTRIGASGVVVSRSGAGSAGDPYVYSITVARELGNIPQLTSTNTFTGGTTPTVTHATGTAGTGTGKYGPYDPAATDGRQLIEPGKFWWLNETVVKTPVLGWGAPDTDHPAVFDGGIVWEARLLMTAGTHSLAAGPTIAEVRAACPRLQFVSEA